MTTGHARGAADQLSNLCDVWRRLLIPATSRTE
jgi:hypothetical protein